MLFKEWLISYINIDCAPLFTNRIKNWRLHFKSLDIPLWMNQDFARSFIYNRRRIEFALPLQLISSSGSIRIPLYTLRSRGDRRTSEDDSHKYNNKYNTKHLVTRRPLGEC